MIVVDTFIAGAMVCVALLFFGKFLWPLFLPSEDPLELRRKRIQSLKEELLEQERLEQEEARLQEELEEKAQKAHASLIEKMARARGRNNTP